MPARSKSSNVDPPQPSILLLEEYDALAAAISSALKKFAPHHTAVVARSLSELEKLADDLNPELFIFDVDPPWSGLTNLIEQIQDSHPIARALVIGGPIPYEIATERASSGALQFIEKPFELATFGAAVQALLGPRAESRGTLRVFGQIDAVLLQCTSNVGVTVEVRSRSRSGEIDFAGGQVTHAETGNLRGEEAFAEILSWPKANLSERRMFGSPRRTIAANWPTIVVEALREAQAEIAEPEPTQTKAIQLKAGKKVVVIDDTEMLLIFVEDILATSEPELQITTAMSGSEGLREVEQIIPDLVLLDYSLPDFNGDEVCRRLLENERTAHVPVLMMSGHVAQMNSTSARFPNVVATIEKPFLSDALVDLVRRTLASSKTLIQERTAKPAPAPRIVEATPPSPPSPPPKQEIKLAPPARIIREPSPPPIERWIEQRKPPAAPAPIRIAPTDGSTAVLGIFLEVLSMQLTSQLQMGAIRAQPSSLTASLRLESVAARNAIPAETGFQLGPAQFSAEGRISALRLLPTSKPFQPTQMRSAFEIGGVAVIPNETRARVQLTPAGTTPMIMQLSAQLELNAVELTQNFQVAQLILNWPATAVRVSLNPKAPEQTAAKFDMLVEKLDSSGRIAQVLLSPVR
ncbi:MAG: response regulator [Verrucomicrobia bacterium]|nr:response regulator [Verrucomicrobiota bacterium]